MNESEIIERLRRIATAPAARGLLDDAAVLDGFVITHDSIASAKEAGAALRNDQGRHILIYEVIPAGILDPVRPITDNDVPPGGTPVALAA